MQIKTIIANKFWIVEENERKIGTINSIDGKFKAIINGEIIWFDKWEDFDKPIAIVEAEHKKEKEYEVYGYSTNYKPHNVSWDEQKKVGIYTKSESSSIQFCSGYFIIKFENGWTQWFCPKLETLNKREWIGPFKTELESREQKRLKNA